MSKKYFESEALKDAMWKNFYREEDKWESMPEADFLDVHGGCPRHWFQLGFGAGLDAVVRADPVPQEISAREYLRAQKRMCKSFPLCDSINRCPFFDECGSELSERGIEIVEKWAAEHPERSDDE